MNGIPLRKLAVACVLTLSGAVPLAAQQDKSGEPGLYSHTIEGETYLQKGVQSLDLPRGQSGFAGDYKLQELDVIPAIIANDTSLPPGLAGRLRGCGFYAGSRPPLGDQPLQSDFERFDRRILDEIDRFLEQGYPSASVLMHAASTGVSVDRALYAAVQSQPDQIDELYMAALELMAFLPGWACTAGADTGMYDSLYNVNDLPDSRMVRDVAQRYFEGRARLAQFPDWPNDEFHMLASADELLDLLSQLESEYWYRPGPSQEGPGANPRGAVLIALYPEAGNGEQEEGQNTDDQGFDGRVVIDTTAEQIRKWKEAGRDRIPVIFFYNFEYQRHISDYDEDVTLEQIMESFFEDGEELTPVPLFTVGDYHLNVPADELEALFDLPDSDDIDPARYQALEDDLAANGFSRKPVMVSLLRSASYRKLAESDRVRVAIDRGVEQFPVALFYHRLNREPCGAPAICFENLCDALVCAGADPNSCLDPAAAGAIQRSFEVPQGGGGGSQPQSDSPPPPPPPASPS